MQQQNSFSHVHEGGLNQKVELRCKKPKHLNRMPFYWEIQVYLELASQLFEKSVLSNMRYKTYSSYTVY